MKLLEFTCEEDLSKYVDSMLFNSGTGIARGVFEHDGRKIRIDLEVCGEVAVTFNGETYHDPLEFPEELISRIKARPNDWMYPQPDEDNGDAEDDIYVGLNNWFEYVFDNGDGEVYEEDLAKATKDDILEDMKAIAAQHFGIDGCYGAGSEACLNHCKNCA